MSESCDWCTRMSDGERPSWAVRLQAEREARGWNKREMARQLHKAAGNEHAPVDSLARQIRGWESGKHFPRDWAAAYATAFGMDEADVFGPRPGTTHTARALTADIEAEVKRRTLLGLLGTAAAGPLAEHAEKLRTALNSAVDSAPTDRDADAWERVAYDYSHEVGALPSDQVLSELLADFAEINVLIREAAGSVRCHLVHSAAHLAALAAITFINLGDPRSARRWWRTASRAADESGDHLASSLVRGRQAVFSLYEDRPSMSVLDLADEAIEISRSTPCAGLASAYAAKAQTLAQIGRHPAAAAALDDLKRIFEVMPDSVRDDQSSQWGWSAQRLHHVASHVHTFAGNVEKASRAQDTALTLYPPSNYQGRAQVELHRAGCLMRSGDIDEGARHTVRVLEGLPVAHRADGLLRRTALVTLTLAQQPVAATKRPALAEAYELLDTPGDQ
jgi:tetratricopeptide (TPR) repeat protein